MRIYLPILLVLLASSQVWAQDTEADASDESRAEEESTAPEDEVTDEEVEELLGLDEDYTEIEEDDFDPTEDVRFEQSINFPTDI